MAITPTETEISRLRRQLALNETQLPDDEIQALYTEAEELYPLATYSRAVIFAAVRLQGAKDLLAEVAQRVTYSQNQSREQLSDLTKNVKELVRLYTDELAELLNTENPALPPARWGWTKTTPSVKLEYPNG